MKFSNRFLPILLLLSLLTSNTATADFPNVHRTSFEETQTRYLSPLDMAELFMKRFPMFIADISCDAYYADQPGSKSLRVLLGENRPSTGEPDTLAPSAGLITKLKSCTESALSLEIGIFGPYDHTRASHPTINKRVRDEQSAELKKFIPCRADKCSTKPYEWMDLKMSDLSNEDQRILIRELLLKVWGTLRVYEEINGASAEDLISALQKQTESLSLTDTYRKVQVWAALRDEFLMF